MDWDKIAAFLWGLSVGIILGSVVWSAAVYAFLTLKDWIRKRQEGNYKLGKNINKSRTPKLISLDDD